MILITRKWRRPRPAHLQTLDAVSCHGGDEKMQMRSGRLKRSEEARVYTTVWSESPLLKTSRAGHPHFPQHLRKKTAVAKGREHQRGLYYTTTLPLACAAQALLCPC